MYTIFEYGILLGVCAYYVGNYKESIDACSRALKSKEFCSPSDAERIKNNMRMSIEKLKERMEKEKK